MRILLTESVAGDAAALEIAAEDRGVEVVRCQPADGPVTPCVGFLGDAPCPLDRHVDAVVGVRRSDDRELSGPELGLACALRAGVPIIVVGDNPLGTAAVPAAADDAIDVALGIAERDTGRPTAAEVARQVKKVLLELGARQSVTWVGYADRSDGFDVVVELSHAATFSTRERLDVALTQMFWQAVRTNRFGRIVYEHRTRSGR
jgi:hypothetical protein